MTIASPTTWGWISCVAAGMGSALFLSSSPPNEGEDHGRQSTTLHAAMSPSEDRRHIEASADEIQSAEKTLRQKVEFLERGREFLRTKAGYTARFLKQEFVQDELLDEQSILLKCRREPFSVYLAWEAGSQGREVLFVEGENNGKLIAHEGGWKARLPSMSLKPDCSLAMADARYPVTDAGLAGLVEIMLATHRQDLSHASYASCTVRKSEGANSRPCYEFTTRYKSAAESPIYRKSITCVDEEWNLPLITHHFTWPKKNPAGTEDALDADTLIEAYRFDDVDFHYQPQAADFDRSNAAYHF